MRPANRSRDAGSGIHDDETAKSAGFRGGTVAGNIHLDHFPPLLVDAFGPRWFERGFISQYFRTPTTHLDPVHAAHAPPTGDQERSEELVPAWVVTPGGVLVAEGSAGVGDHPPPTPLRARDRRAVDPGDLDLLVDAPLGTEIQAGVTRVNMERQRALLADRSLLPQPLDWYGDRSPWGPPVACPSVAVDLLWGPFERTIRPFIKPAIGLYGAIELHHRNGPLVADRDYRLVGTILAASESPRTEIFWAETTAWDGDTATATLVMMIRLLRPNH